MFPIVSVMSLCPEKVVLNTYGHLCRHRCSRLVNGSKMVVALARICEEAKA